MEEEKKEEEKAEEKKKEEKIPGTEVAEETVGMAQGIIGKIGNLIDGILGGGKEEKK